MWLASHLYWLVPLTGGSLSTGTYLYSLTVVTPFGYCSGFRLQALPLPDPPEDDSSAPNTSPAHHVDPRCP